MLIEVQFSIYPLREEHISPFIERAVEIVKSAMLPVEVGAMSSITYGESAAVFKAFDEIIEELGGKAQFVLVLTISNACPVNLKKESSE